MIGIASAVQGVVGSVLGFFGRRSERAHAREMVAAKAQAARLRAEDTISLTQSEIDVLVTEKSDSTWRDEFVTVVVFAPLIALLIGVAQSVLGGDDRLLSAARQMIAEMDSLRADSVYGWMLIGATSAALGIRAFKRRD